MSQMAIRVVVVLSIGVACGYALRTLAQQVRSKPAFTLQFEERSLSGSGATGDIKWIYAQRGDGSTVRINLDASGSSVGRRIMLIPDRKVVNVADEIRAISTTYLSPEKIQAHVSDPSDPTCETLPELAEGIAHRVLGTTTFLGVRVVRHVLELPGGTTERWESPECSCEAVLQRAVRKNPDGSIRATNDRIATAITLGEPDAALFQIPTDYAEKPPSALMDELWRLKGRNTPPPDMLPKLERSDRQYYESQALRQKD